MASKIFQKIICIYFLVSCLLMVTCFLIVAVDCTNKVGGGEFRLLPVLNGVQFRHSEIPEQDFKMLERAVAFSDQLCMSGHAPWNDLLWHFINISTIISLCNPLFCFFLYLFDMRLPRWSLRLVQIVGGIALLLIFAVRIYMDGSWGSVDVRLSYPIAYITLSELLSKLFLPVFILSVLAGIKKLLREE